MCRSDIHCHTQEVIVACRQWHRARAAKLQADAAVNLASADFRHARNGCKSMARYWEAATNEPGVSPGGRAYAFQQSAMYTSIADRCQSVYDAARRAGMDGEQLDFSLVRFFESSAAFMIDLMWTYSRCNRTYSRLLPTSSHTEQSLRS